MPAAPRLYPPPTQAPRAYPRTRNSGSSAAAQRVRKANFTLATDPSSIIQSIVDAANGVTVVLQNSAAARDLPNTGACYVRPGVYDQAGLLLGANGVVWNPALRRPDCLIQERAKTGADPILARVGLLWMDTASPATCTEGIGFFLDYPGAGAQRRVGIVRVTGVGTWSAASTTTATGVIGHSGCHASNAAGSFGALQGSNALGTDVNGDPFVPIGTNKATHTAAIQMTAGTGWHTGLWFGWAAAGGVNGISVTFDPMYWISQWPGRG